jgi:hypothetical protein
VQERGKIINVVWQEQQENEKKEYLHLEYLKKKTKII